MLVSLVACALAGTLSLSAPRASDGDIGQGGRSTPYVLGHLTCAVFGEAAGEAGGVAQGREVSCRFRPGLSGAEETYVGTLQGAGQVGALFGRGVVMLVVKQLGSDAVRPGMLAQSYAADAAARPGRSTPLVGDRTNTIMLQPMIEPVTGEQPAKGAAADALIVLIELRLAASSA